MPHSISTQGINQCPSTSYSQSQSKLKSFWDVTQKVVTYIKDSASIENVGRGFNALVDSGVFHNILTTKATFEKTADLVVHTFHVFLPENNASLALATALNVGRLMSIYYYGVTLTSDISYELNLADVANHSFNLVLIGYIYAKHNLSLPKQADKSN